MVGKQLGIFGAVRLAIRLGIGGRLGGATWLQIWGMAMLCGIGFTMSLFIGALAFPGDPLRIEQAKVGVLLGSFVAALLGYVVLRLAPAHPDHAREERRIGSEIDQDGDADFLVADSSSPGDGDGFAGAR